MKEVHDIDKQQRKYQELIRCKDCEHYSERWKVCDEFDYRQLPEDFYCAAAKKRDTEHKELVRCKDCKHYNKRWKMCCVDIASFYHLQYPEDYYCASAERRDEQ